MKREGRVYGWSTEGWKPKGCLSQPWPCNSSKVASSPMQKNTQIDIASQNIASRPKFRPDNRNKAHWKA
jgi:hypothetical protein